MLLAGCGWIPVHDLIVKIFGKSFDEGVQGRLGEVLEIQQDKAVQTVVEQRIHIEADDPGSEGEVLLDKHGLAVFAVRNGNYQFIEFVGVFDMAEQLLGIDC